MKCTATLALFLVVAGLAGCAWHAPYAGLQSREVKALSASDIEGLRAGRGMSLVFVAELNGYPGPMHTLELADKLGLSPSQRDATTALFRRMQADAIAAGEAYIAAERDLDRLFADRSVDPQKLEQALGRVAQAHARVRGVHLQAHLEQLRLLAPEQVARYRQLRGYGD